MRVRIDTNTLLRRLVDAETAQRGYLLTGRTEYLDPYRNADADVLRGLAEVREHFGLDPASQIALDELTRHARGRLAELATTIGMYESGDHLGWKGILVSGQGRVTMNAVRSSAQKLLDGQDRHIKAEQTIVYDVLDRGRSAVHITTLLALIWLIFFLRKNRALQRAMAAHAQDLQEQRDALERKVELRTAELRELNAHLQDVREVERAKLARLLHDELGALLTAAKLDLARLRRALPTAPADVMARLQHMGDAIDQGVMLKRHVIEDLSPSALHNLGLRAALEILVSEFRRNHQADVALDVEDVALSDSPRIAVYRLVQECLDNLQRHAAAAAARVIVRRAESQLLVQISDSGPGFDPAQVSPTSHGLRKLRHRIEALGGHLFVISAPGRGTEVEARLPLTAQSATV